MDLRASFVSDDCRKPETSKPGTTFQTYPDETAVFKGQYAQHAYNIVSLQMHEHFD